MKPLIEQDTFTYRPSLCQRSIRRYPTRKLIRCVSRTYVYMVVALLLVAFLFKSPVRITLDPSLSNSIQKKELTFQETLLKLASDERIIYLSSIDNAYLPMAKNLYLSSYKKLDIENYLFVCSDTHAYMGLNEHGINAFDFFKTKGNPSLSSDYGTAAFKRKTHMKTKIILDALLLDLTVLIVDVDIVLFKDPVPYMDCKECDLQIQSDRSERNSGFYMVKPSPGSIKLHKKAWEIGSSDQGEKTSNQKVINKIMNTMIKEKQLTVKTLSTDTFPHGLAYFENNVRMFYSDNKPNKEILVHNNWIVSKAAKIYRFKEHRLWLIDDDGYYSNPNRKYLKYENPVLTVKRNTQQLESNALKAALIIAHLLQRTLILPAFNCQNCKFKACTVATKQCSLNTHYKIETFDSVLGDAYREHVFLDHPLVPDSIKEKSRIYLIQTNPMDLKIPKHEKDSMVILTPNNPSRGPEIAEILNWFSEKKDPVLYFYSMYNLLNGLKQLDFYETVNKAIDENIDYRQFKKV